MFKSYAFAHAMCSSVCINISSLNHKYEYGNYSAKKSYKLWHPKNTSAKLHINGKHFTHNKMRPLQNDAFTLLFGYVDVQLISWVCV